MIGRLTYAVLRRFFNIYVSCFDGKEYKNDPNYNIDFIDECFDSRKSQITDSNIFERITNSYNKSKIVQKNVGDVYQVGNEWAPIYKKYMGKIMEVLNEKDLDSMKQIYNNFMREKCSVGLHGIGGYERMKENYFSGNISQRNARLYELKNYFGIINRVSKKYIYHINHTKYSSMSADNFPINLDKFELDNRQPALWNKAINFSMDEFEFLYKKLS